MLTDIPLARANLAALVPVYDSHAEEWYAPAAATRPPSGAPGGPMSEHDEQVAVFEWVALNTPRLPELALLFHPPNGGKRHIVTATRLKAEGEKPGVPDLWLPVARLGYHGLVIELKTERGRLSAAQAWWIDALRKQGYHAEICRGWQTAVSVIETYLTWRP